MMDLKNLIALLYKFISSKLDIKESPRVILVNNDIENRDKDPFGLTAFYDSQNKIIKLYTSGRLKVDILRSFSHEVVHHFQNERGNLGDATQQGYAQTDPHLREMEAEAYLKGNLLFRDFQDMIRKQKNINN